MNTATAITIAALAALTPTVTCLIGIILSRQDVRRLEDKMDQRMQSFERNMDGRLGQMDQRLDKMDHRLDKMDQSLKTIDDHLMHFYSITGRLEGRLDTIEKRTT